MTDPDGSSISPIDWESFYRNFRKPGYIPGYDITTKLGGGVFGLVFKARKQSIGKDYAIKFLKVDDHEVRKAVHSELESVRFFAQVDHPNLVSIEDKGEVDGIPYIIMAYAGNETLQTRLQADDTDTNTDRNTDKNTDTPTDRMRLLYLFLQACRGVQALHERSLVHFDLKPTNIFLKGDVARVGDYGLSKMVTCSRNSLSMGRGTPYYMAPEMLRRKGDHRSDIYSLGIILYECLTGELPFTGSSEWEVLDKHEKQAPSFPADLEPGYCRVIEGCLAKNPDKRWNSVEAFVAALREPTAARMPRAVPGNPVPGNPVPPPPTGNQPKAGLGNQANLSDQPNPPNQPNQPNQPHPAPAANLQDSLARGVAAATSSVNEAADTIRSAGSRIMVDRAMRRARRRNNGRLAVIILFVVISWGMLSMFAVGKFRPGRGSSRVEAFARNRSASAFIEQSSRPVLRERDMARITAFEGGPPSDLPRLRRPDRVSSRAWPNINDRVEAIARGRSVRGNTDGLLRDPYAAFIASLNYLRDLNYRSLKETKYAVRVQNLLKELTHGVSYEIVAPPSGLDEFTAQRNAEAVEHWFLFLVNYAQDRDAFSRTLDNRKHSRDR